MPSNQENQGSQPSPQDLPVPASLQLAVSAVSLPGITTSIEAFNQPLALYLARIGLPTENVLAPIEERRNEMEGLANALASLPYSERQLPNICSVAQKHVKGVKLHFVIVLAAVQAIEVGGPIDVKQHGFAVQNEGR